MSCACAWLLYPRIDCYRDIFAEFRELRGETLLQSDCANVVGGEIHPVRQAVSISKIHTIEEPPGKDLHHLARGEAPRYAPLVLYILDLLIHQ